MTQTNRMNEKGNVVVVILVALVVAAIGGMAYMSGFLTKEERSASDAKAPTAIETASGDATQDESIKAPAPQAQLDIKPGNPVVAKIGGRDVKRMDVFNFMQTLPAETRQLPMQQLFPLVQNQLINMAIIKEKAEKANMDNDPLVKQQLEEAKKNIVPAVYLQRQVENNLTDERLKKAYDQYTANFPKAQEAQARHILVDDEKLAKDLIKKLDGGASFEELAKENSKDSTAKDGGLLAYFVQAEVVPEFGAAAFEQEIGAISKKPIKTQFGYHIIKVEDRRERQPETFEKAKPFLAAQLRNVVTNEVLMNFRKKAGVEIFDINGESIEPAAGEEEPAKPEMKEEEKPAEKADQ